jgi:hypothetical protein
MLMSEVLTPCFVFLWRPTQRLSKTRERVPQRMAARQFSSVLILAPEVTFKEFLRQAFAFFAEH